jgi:proteasome accessory factor B
MVVQGIAINKTSTRLNRRASGIIARMGDPVIVRLRFTKAQGDYILTQPIHESQVVEKETKDYLTIRLTVCIAYELITSIVGWGDQVKVPEPKSLKDEIREIHRKAMGLY